MIARHHDVGASGQWPPGERVPSLAAHDAGLAQGERLEAFQIIGNAPWQCALVPDHAVLREGYNEGKRNPFLLIPKRPRSGRLKGRTVFLILRRPRSGRLKGHTLLLILR